jgi:hypothetical protein
MPDVIGDMKGQVVVLDLVSEYVMIGTLLERDDQFLTLSDADVHDLRASSSTRDFYVFQAKEAGHKRNRKRVAVRLEQIVSISALDDVTL